LTRRAFLAGGVGLSASIATALTSAGTAVARFELLHASPDLQPVDAYIGGFRLQAGLPYTQFSKRFVINTGTYSIRVYPAGGDPNAPPLREIPVGFEPNQRFLVGLVNVAASLEGVAYLEPPLPAAGQATIRLINLEPGSPPLDLVDATNNAVLIGDVAFKTAKSATVPQTNLTLQLRQTGTANVVLAIAPTNFPGGNVSTLIKFAPEPAVAQARAAGQPLPPSRQLILRRTK
jgi:hypothetical protein